MNDRGFPPLLFSILSFCFHFFFFLLPSSNTGIRQFNWRGQERREYRIRCWSLSPVTARFNLLLLRTLGGSAARMKSYLRPANPLQLSRCPRRETRIIEKSSEAAIVPRPTRSVINGSLWNRTPEREGHESMLGEQVKQPGSRGGLRTF